MKIVHLETILAVRPFMDTMIESEYDLVEQLSDLDTTDSLDEIHEIPLYRIYQKYVLGAK